MESLEAVVDDSVASGDQIDTVAIDIPKEDQSLESSVSSRGRSDSFTIEIPDEDQGIKKDVVLKGDENGVTVISPKFTRIRSDSFTIEIPDKHDDEVLEKYQGKEKNRENGESDLNSPKSSRIRSDSFTIEIPDDHDGEILEKYQRKEENGESDVVVNSLKSSRIRTDSFTIEIPDEHQNGEENAEAELLNKTREKEEPENRLVDEHQNENLLQDDLVVDKELKKEEFLGDVTLEHGDERDDPNSYPSNYTIDIGDELPWRMYETNRMQEDEEKEEPFDSDPVKPSDSNDELYCPSPDEDLEDPYETICDLEEMNINFKNVTERVEFESKKKEVLTEEISELKVGILEEEIKIYLDEFEEEIKQEMLVVANMSFDEIRDQERFLREKEVRFQEELAKVQRQRLEQLLKAMDKAKTHVLNKYRKRFEEVCVREKLLMQRDKGYKKAIQKEFRRAQNQLLKVLKQRKGEVKAMYGSLTFADGDYGGSQCRRWKIDWARSPQPIEIRVICLRGTKDKLPPGEYVLMVSLYKSLGGPVLKWSTLRGEEWSKATTPVKYDGDYFNIELKIEQSVFTVCPSQPDIQPGMVLVFELFLLRGQLNHTDTVVAWGCFPVCDPGFKILQGKYKTPMLRGNIDPGIDKYETIESLIANDLDNWLCNLYFEIIRLPRFFGSHKEYEVEVQFTSRLLNAPERIDIEKQNNEEDDEEIAGYKSERDLLTHSDTSFISGSSIKSKPKSRCSIGGEMKGGSEIVVKVSSPVTSPDSKEKRPDREDEGVIEAESNFLTVPILNQSKADGLRKRNVSHFEKKGLKRYSSRYSSNKNATRSNDEYHPVEGEPGMFYRIIPEHVGRKDGLPAKKVHHRMEPETPLLAKRNPRQFWSREEFLDVHTVSVNPLGGFQKGSIEHPLNKKLRWITRMLMSELGLGNFKRRSFWALLFLVVVTFWMRMYLHYIGQWGILNAYKTPISHFSFYPHTVYLNYQNNMLRTREELLLVIVGPFTNITVFILVIFVAVWIQLLFHRFPDIFSKLILSFGVHCVLDPIWILIVDCALSRYYNRGGDYPIGDAFKLYWHFRQFYLNDNVTLFISIALSTVIYSISMFCSLALLYLYFLRIHNNSRLMDVYFRLHGNEQQFFIPYDLEISNEELSFICAKAEKWRGDGGERRKIVVYDYYWEEECLDKGWDDDSQTKHGRKERTTHISIYTLFLDGSKDLYRHFLKLSEGAIVEVFGESDVSGAIQAKVTQKR